MGPSRGVCGFFSYVLFDKACTLRDITNLHHRTKFIHMKKFFAIIAIACIGVYMSSCNQPRTAAEEITADRSATDIELAEFISKIKAVDNHTHANTIDPDDKGFDALPLDALFPFELPARVRPESQVWLTASKAVYGFKAIALNEKTMKDLADTAASVMKQKAEKFPEWALDQAGTEVMLANRIAMGPGLSAPRFRWVSYVDALLFPLSTKAEAAVTPDREKLFPLEATYQNYRPHLMNI